MFHIARVMIQHTLRLCLSMCSDDELTPYDMSDDKEMSAASPPRYLRDCLESMALQDLFGHPLLKVHFCLHQL